MQVVAQNNNEGVTATMCFSPFSLFREKHEKHNFRPFSKYVFFSCKNELDMFENSEFRRFCNDFTALSEKKLDFSDFVSAIRVLSPNFIKLKNCIQKVYDSP